MAVYFNGNGYEPDPPFQSYWPDTIANYTSERAPIFDDSSFYDDTLNAAWHSFVERNTAQDEYSPDPQWHYEPDYESQELYYSPLPSQHKSRWSEALEEVLENEVIEQEPEEFLPPVLYKIAGNPHRTKVRRVPGDDGDLYAQLPTWVFAGEKLCDFIEESGCSPEFAAYLREYLPDIDKVTERLHDIERMARRVRLLLIEGGEVTE